MIKWCGVNIDMKILFVTQYFYPEVFRGNDVCFELASKGHEVTVYNPHFHEYNKDSYNGVAITKIWSPENYCGAMANFIYDYLCLKDALDKDFDIIYECGYHSNALSYYLLDKSSPIVITNMDGIEWKRSKWNSAVKSLIKGLEKIAVKKSHYLISDNEGIQKYYKDEHNVDSFYISYGADIVDSFNDDYLKEFTLNKFQYYILIARLLMNS